MDSSSLVAEIIASLTEHGFRQVTNGPDSIPAAKALLKRQTWNTNRAVVVVDLAEIPGDFKEYLRRLRNQVAFRCKFFPFFWGIGIQAVVIAPHIATQGIDPAMHVARVDNQWAIIQSVFLVDTAAQSFFEGRTWGQFVTGKYQDAIADVLSGHLKRQDRKDG